MPDQKIRIDVGTQTAALQDLHQKLKMIEGDFRGIAAAGKDASKEAGGLLGNAGRGSGGSSSGGSSGGAASGGSGGGKESVGRRMGAEAASMMRQIGSLFGLGMALSPVLAMRDAVRFDMNALSSGQGLGISPQSVDAFNRQQTAWNGLGARYAYSKDEVMSAADQAAAEGLLSKSQKSKLFNDEEGMNGLLRSARVMGIDSGKMGGYTGRLARTFDLGPESFDRIANAFFKGAEMAGLSKREDFVKFAADFSETFRGLNARMEDTVGLMAALQDLAPREFKGETAATFGKTLRDLWEAYVFRGGEGMTPYMLGLASQAGGTEFAAQNPVDWMKNLTKGIALDPQLSGQKMLSNRWRWLSNIAGLGPELARMVEQINATKNPEEMEKILNSLTGPDATTGGKMQQEMDLLNKDQSFTARQVELNVVNKMYRESERALQALTGQVDDATGALGAWTSALGLGAAGGIGGAGSMGMSFFGDFLGSALGGAVGAKGLGGIGGLLTRGRGLFSGLLGRGGAAAAGGIGTQLSLPFAQGLAGGAAGGGILSGARVLAAGLLDKAMMVGRGAAALGGATTAIATSLIAFAALMGKWTGDLGRIKQTEKDEAKNHVKNLADIRAKNPNYKAHKGMRSDYDDSNEMGGVILVDNLLKAWEFLTKNKSPVEAAMSVAGAAGGNSLALTGAVAAGAGYSDNQTHNWYVSEKQANGLYENVSNEKNRKHADLANEVARGVDSPKYYDPYGKRREAPQQANMSELGQAGQLSTARENGMYD